MKHLFPAYQQRSDQDFSKLWPNALFVFDTNVLLHLYRYQRDTQGQMLEILRQLSKDHDLWIPYQVALEFSRKRPGVKAAQLKSYVDLRSQIAESVDRFKDSVSAAALSGHMQLLGTDALFSALSKSVADFTTELDSRMNVVEEELKNDAVKATVDDVFEDSVGPAPTLAEVNEWYKEGELRYSRRIPPGFKDESKGNKSSEEGRTDGYLHNGVFYRMQYGDLLVWKQLLEHAKLKKPDCIVFITDDRKEDWWSIVQGKTIGPRPELIEEAHAAGVSSLIFYKPERFLEFASKYLEAAISPTTLAEVKQVSEESPFSRENSPSPNDIPSLYSEEESAALPMWIYRRHPTGFFERLSPFAYTVTVGREKVNYVFVTGNLSDSTGELFAWAERTVRSIVREREALGHGIQEIVPVFIYREGEDVGTWINSLEGNFAFNFVPWKEQIYAKFRRLPSGLLVLATLGE